MKKSKTVLLAVLIFSGCARVQPDREPAAVCSAGSLTVMKMGFHTVASCDKNRGDGLSSLFKKARKYWQEYDGTVEVSYSLKESGVSRTGETFNITVPDPEIAVHIDTKNAKDPYVTEDAWLVKNPITPEEQEELFKKAKLEMLDSIQNDQDLIKRAKQRYKELLSSYIASIGRQHDREYKVVFVE
ncbi:DUF4230 domain-containing protein [Faecalibaculum rodentium]|uniref:DUF4230 domain-containing protein n=3 Tax=Faecalibaculum rodentium TaxID=1702221 RepID=UPI0023EFE35E|nr:DUF4230 domain-containing protein [Faecalibaculum rodentium]